ncbi:hypothetical protein Cgig2_030669 [Carnegiea gigantea]|uniref:Ubiquitin-like protease family profile domain-containing protein n=1 Tax=Carnegiea gigantea TaxID=171969 RepID=A0A9Q1JSS9_9CARY|nr:hypothetical protein Cgig2_030669 [Carnegiea gigantea]
MKLPKLQPRHICADYLEGLVHVVPKYGARDDAGKHCIGGFAIDLYSSLLDEQQGSFPKLYWRSLFLARHDKVSQILLTMTLQTPLCSFQCSAWGTQSDVLQKCNKLKKQVHIISLKFRLALCGSDVQDHVLQAKLTNAADVSGAIWEKLKKQVDGRLRFVFMPLYEVEGKHWFLFVADIRDR